MQVISFGLLRPIFAVFSLFSSQRTMYPSGLHHAGGGRAGVAGLPRVAVRLLPQRDNTQPCCWLHLEGCFVPEAEKPRTCNLFWGRKSLGIKHEFLFYFVWLRSENLVLARLASLPTHSPWQLRLLLFVLRWLVPFLLAALIWEVLFNEISHLTAEFPDTGSLLLDPRRFKNMQRNFSTHAEQSVSHGRAGSRLGSGGFGR